MEKIDPDALAALEVYPWPGNVRELENVIQSAIILAHKETLRAEDFPLKIQEIQEENVVEFGDFHPVGSFERQLRDYKVKLAVTAVRENNGNKTLAARSLCISRAYLHRLIRLAEPGTVFEQDAPEIIKSA
jgi:DNA-binding NtrC family response regulator